MKKSNTKLNSIFKWGDLIVLSVLILAVVFSLWFAFRPLGGQYVEIYKNGELLYNVSLFQDKEIVIDQDGYNIVKIENGVVLMLQSSCKGQDCVRSHAISKEGGIIVCLPNKIVVRVVTTDVDAIT